MNGRYLFTLQLHVIHVVIEIFQVIQSDLKFTQTKYILLES